MPGFSYVAVDAAGKEVKGSMEADDKERVAEQLRKDGLLPMSIREQGFPAGFSGHLPIDDGQHGQSR